MKKVSMQTIAEALGVSKNTVSLALRNDPQISRPTRERIRQTAQHLGYRRDPVVGQVMAGIRSARGAQGALALCNAHHDPAAFSRHPTIPAYVAGCRQRAEHLGYALNEFWLHDRELSGEQLERILKARGIRGLVVVGLMDDNRLPAQFKNVWRHFSTVVTGVRTRQPALSFACTDHHIVALRAFEKALELGYRRPGLVLDSVIDQLVEGRFTAGYREGQQVLPRNRRLEPFGDVTGARNDRQRFRVWFEKARPDVIFTLYNEVRDWTAEMGFDAPADIGLIQLEWRASKPEWAGMNQHNEVVGEAAIDMLVSMLHNAEVGPPPFPLATLVGGSWVDGQTVQKCFV